MTPVVHAERISKTYRVYTQPWHRLVEPLLRRRLHRPFHALEGVSFELNRGQALGVIGENGAGKSTLLKVLTGITMPSGGRFGVHGTVAAILELGTGFHPEFTGRENIVLNAAMLGLTQAQIEERTPEIIAFSELGAFIDQPVKTYSTGMAMRLAFSIAVQAEPDVLIVDEALSVGDGYFQKKCLDELRRFRDGGGTLLFCSHALYYVSAFCNSAIWLRDGRVEALGDSDEVIRGYEAFLAAKSRGPEAGTVEADRVDEVGGARPPIRWRVVRVVPDRPTSSGTPVQVNPGGSLAIDLAWESADPARALHVGVCLNRSSDNIEICAVGTHRDGMAPVRGSGGMRLNLPNLPLVKGEFTIYAYLLDEAGLHVYDQSIVPSAFVVENPDYDFGVVRMEHHWDVVKSATAPQESLTA